MPKQSSPFLRTFITTVVVLAAGAVAWSVYRSSSKQATPTPAPAVAPATTPGAVPSAAQPTTTAQQPTSAPTTPSAPDAPPSAQPASQPPPTSIPLPPAGWSLSALVHPASVGETSPAIGSLDPAGAPNALVEFSNGGAGVKRLSLSRHFTSIKETDHIEVQFEVPPAQDQQFSALVPMAALALEVTPPAAPGFQATPVSINLYANTAGPIWRSVEPGVFEATIIDGNSAPVLRITRRYTLPDGSFTLKVAQRIDNLSPYALTVRYFQVGPVEMPPGDRSYGGDKRHARFGYLLSAAKDPTQKQVVSHDHVMTHDKLLGDRVGGLYTEKTVWPNEDSSSEGHALVWTGVTDRYYGIAVHPIVHPDALGAGKTLAWVRSITRVVADGGAGREFVGLRLDSAPLLLGPTGTPTAGADVSLAAYAGPLDAGEIAKDELSKSLGIPGMVVFNFGGPCAPCTFPFLTQGILDLLHLLHHYVFKDWSLAIIFLVVIVRSILHPVTKWSQIKIARFGKQMQALAPKQKELQEKYKGDTAKIQAEMTRLWREEGVSPTGMLGCVPMFLQMPIWIALSATLYFAVELRHQGAFYGLFQNIQPLNSPFWQFLGDLAEPDRLLYAGRALFTVPLLGEISSLNILPLLLGVVFYMQQKYIQQPSTAMTPEQEMQMKMMKWMSVIMFPLFMYNAPAGLSLYFTVNSTFAILESKWIRAHMDKHGLLDMEKMKAERAAKKGGKGGSGGASGGEGFMARLQRAVEERQKAATKDAIKRKK